MKNFTIKLALFAFLSSLSLSTMPSPGSNLELIQEIVKTPQQRISDTISLEETTLLRHSTSAMQAHLEFLTNSAYTFCNFPSSEADRRECLINAITSAQTWKLEDPNATFPRAFHRNTSK